MAKGNELTTTITLEGSVAESLKKAFDNAEGMAEKSSGKINSVMGKLGGFASGAVKAGLATAATGIAAVGTAAVAGAKAALDLGMRFDEAADNIRIGTGATGKALDDLNNSFDKVYKSVPTTMEAASQAIADYNTRLGLTGPELEGISEQAIQVSNLLGDDLGSVIEESSQAFQQWDIAAEDMGGAMDYVFKAAQSTGVGFTTLMNGVQAYGAQMQDMGFTFEETTALLGQLDKAGVNSGEVMGALKKSVASFAKDGKSAADGLTEYIQKIQEAGSAAEATALAGEVFGNKAGSTMASAIREGKLSVSELVAELEKSDETIMKAAEDTEDFPQKLQKLKASAEVALKPMANTFVDMANNAMPLVSDTLEKLIPEVSGVMTELAPAIGDTVNTVVPVVGEGLQELAPVFGDAVKSVLPIATSLIQKITPIIKGGLSMIPGIVNGIKSAISGVRPIINSVIPLIQSGIAGIKDGIVAAAPMMQQIFDAAVPALQSIAAAIMPIATTIATQVFPVIQQVAGLLMSTLTPIIVQIYNVISSLMPVITPLIQSTLTMLSALFQNVLIPIAAFLANNLVANIQNILTVVTPVVSGIITALTGVMTFLTGVFTGNWQLAWEGIKTIFTGIWDAMKAVVKGVINTIIDAINGVIKGINSVAGAIGDAVGVQIKIPLIPKLALATGGTVTSPTVALIGEGGEPETVIPHNNSARSRSLLNEAARGVYGAGATVTGGGSDNRTYNITFSPVIEGAGLTDRALQDAFEEFKRNITAYLDERDREAFA